MEALRLLHLSPLAHWPGSSSANTPAVPIGKLTKAIVTQWDKAGRWDGPRNQKLGQGTSSATEVKEQKRTTIIDATEAFMAHRQNRGVAPATLKKYKTFTTQLKSFGESRGYVYLDQLTVSDMDRFSPHGRATSDRTARNWNG